MQLCADLPCCKRSTWGIHCEAQKGDALLLEGFQTRKELGSFTKALW